MKTNTTKFIKSIGAKDLKYFCDVLWLLNSDDISLFDFEQSSFLQELLDALEYNGIVWVASDDRVLLTSYGQTILQELLADLVDFKPSSSKLKSI